MRDAPEARFRCSRSGNHPRMVTTAYPRAGFSLFTLLYFVAGGIVAATHHYWQHVHALKPIVSALLATVLWPLLLFGINLHIH